MSKVPSKALRQAGLSLMARAGKPLERVEERRPALIYKQPDGRTVRLRSSNDRVLIAAAASTEDDAQLDIEGTDDLLLVMPEARRTPGPVVAYLVPTSVAAGALRTAHHEWMASNPSTKGDNRTWSLWFDAGGPPSCNGFAKKWDGYKLSGSVAVTA